METSVFQEVTLVFLYIIIVSWVLYTSYYILFIYLFSLPPFLSFLLFPHTWWFFITLGHVYLNVDSLCCVCMCDVGRGKDFRKRHVEKWQMLMLWFMMVHIWFYFGESRIFKLSIYIFNILICILYVLHYKRLKVLKTCGCAPYYKQLGALNKTRLPIVTITIIATNDLAPNLKYIN